MDEGPEDEGNGTGYIDTRPPRGQQHDPAFIRLISQWVGDCCEKDANSWVGSTALFQSWSAWCLIDQDYIGSIRVLSMTLENIGWVKRRNPAKTLNGFVGWKLRVVPRPRTYKEPDIRDGYWKNP